MTTEVTGSDPWLLKSGLQNAMSSLSGSLLETKNLRPHPRPSEAQATF